MMARTRFTPAARDDFSEIRRYIARDNPVRAKSFIEDIRAHCRRLAINPLSHPVEPALDATARKAVHGSYLIFYDAQDDGILVLRILHGARDLGRLALNS